MGSRVDCQFKDSIFRERKGKGAIIARDKNKIHEVKSQKISSFEKCIPNLLLSKTIGRQATKIPFRVLGKPVKL